LGHWFIGVHLIEEKPAVKMALAAACIYQLQAILREVAL